MGEGEEWGGMWTGGGDEAVMGTWGGYIGWW